MVAAMGYLVLPSPEAPTDQNTAYETPARVEIVKPIPVVDPEPVRESSYADPALQASVNDHERRIAGLEEKIRSIKSCVCPPQVQTPAPVQMPVQPPIQYQQPVQAAPPVTFWSNQQTQTCVGPNCNPSFQGTPQRRRLFRW